MWRKIRGKERFAFLRLILVLVMMLLSVMPARKDFVCTQDEEVHSRAYDRTSHYSNYLVVTDFL